MLMKTILRSSTCDETVHSSRFIGWSCRLNHEAELSTMLDRARSEWPRASHYAFAYRIEPGNERASDDGEPHASAGLPMLHIIQKRELVQTLVVVIRYFGGTKLGRGGLVKAYQDICSKSLDQAELRELVSSYQVHVVLDYAQYEIVQHQLQLKAIHPTATFLEQVCLDFYCPTDTWEQLYPTLRPLVQHLEHTDACLRVLPDA